MANPAKINVTAEDRGLSSCFELCLVKQPWAKSFSDHHQLELLEDFVGIVQALDEKGSETWEASLTKQVKAVSGLETNQIALARFKAAYLAARDALQLCRSAAGKTGSEELDSPIPEGPDRQLQSDWKKRYAIVLTPFLDPSDALKGRVWREFKRHTMTVIEAKKAKNVLCLTLQQSHEKVQLPGGLSLSFDNERNLVLVSCVDYYFALRILGNAMAFVGNYTVTCSSDGKDVLMCDLTCVMDYADGALRAAMEYGSGSVEWLRRNDILTRGQVVSLVRQGWSVTNAFKEAWRQHHNNWNSKSLPPLSAEVPPDTQRRGTGGLGGGGPKGGGRGDRGADRGSGRGRSRDRGGSGRDYDRRDRRDDRREDRRDDRRERPRDSPPRVRTVSMFKGNKRVCKPWNDNRGCDDPKCPDEHRCDVLLSNGQACGERHPRYRHPAQSKDGASPKKRRSD